jgi:hypothetical protein
MGATEAALEKAQERIARLEGSLADERVASRSALAAAHDGVKVGVVIHPRAAMSSRGTSGAGGEHITPVAPCKLAGAGASQEVRTLSTPCPGLARRMGYGHP